MNSNISAPFGTIYATDSFTRGQYTHKGAFTLAQKEKIPLEEAAVKLKEEILSLNNTYIERIEIVEGHLNIFCTAHYYNNMLALSLQDTWGESDSAKNEVVIVEHTDPNPFKVMHIGHMMSNAIGESLARIIESQGARVERACYQGDVGLHVAKTLWSLLQNNTTSPSVEELSTAYVEGSKAYTEGHKEDIDALNKKIYTKEDTHINEIYEYGKRVSLEAFEVLYKKLDSPFNHYFFESEASHKSNVFISTLVSKGILKKDEGAIIYKDSTQSVRVYKTQQGLPTYEGKELGLIVLKEEKFPLKTTSIIVTASEQKARFDNIREILHKEHIAEFENVYHGIMRFGNKKMSSRTGDIISASGILQQLTTAVSNTHTAHNAETIAIAAFKYRVLRQQLHKDIIYNEEEMTSFEGDSGPYIQYTYARIQSLLEKEKQGTSPYHHMPLLHLLDYFPEVVERAYTKRAPHYITQYITKLANVFNSWYGQEKILGQKDTPERLYTCLCVGSTLKKGMELLAITPLQKM